jgi:hypothetical protein
LRARRWPQAQSLEIAFEVLPGFSRLCTGLGGRFVVLVLSDGAPEFCRYCLTIADQAPGLRERGFPPVSTAGGASARDFSGRRWGVIVRNWWWLIEPSAAFISRKRRPPQRSRNFTLGSNAR